MSTTLKFSPSGDSRDGLKIRVQRVRLAPWAHKFHSKVDRSGGPDACWPWLGTRKAGGYGIFILSRDAAPRGIVASHYLAHRAALELASGDPVPTGLSVCHHCDNPPCCNPAHLFAAPQRENLADCHRKERHRFGERHPLAKLDSAKVLELREVYKTRGALGPAAERMGVRFQTAWDAATGRTWAHVGASR